MGGVSWGDRVHAFPGDCSLERDGGYELTTPGFREALGPGVVRYPGADPQLVVVDHVVCAQPLTGFLVREVAPLVARMLMRLGAPYDGLAAALAAFLAAGNPSPRPLPDQPGHAQDGLGRALGALPPGGPVPPAQRGDHPAPGVV